MTTYRHTLRFNPQSAPGTDVNELHKLVMAGYRHRLDDGAASPRAEANILFLAARPGTKPTRTGGRRVLPVAGPTGMVLVQADAPGDWTQTPYTQDRGLNLTVGEPIKVLYDFEAGDTVEVRGLISATRATAPEHDPDTGALGRGKKRTITDPNELGDWLSTRFAKLGFDVDMMDVRVEDMQRIQGHRTDPNATSKVMVDCRQVQFRGEVTDPALFQQTLAEGVGRKRAYGVGLLRHRML